MRRVSSRPRCQRRIADSGESAAWSRPPARRRRCLRGDSDPGSCAASMRNRREPSSPDLPSIHANHRRAGVETIGAFRHRSRKIRPGSHGRRPHGLQELQCRPTADAAANIPRREKPARSCHPMPSESGCPRARSNRPCLAKGACPRTVSNPARRHPARRRSPVPCLHSSPMKSFDAARSWRRSESSSAGRSCGPGSTRKRSLPPTHTHAPRPRGAPVRSGAARPIVRPATCSWLDRRHCFPRKVLQAGADFERRHDRQRSTETCAAGHSGRPGRTSHSRTTGCRRPRHGCPRAEVDFAHLPHRRCAANLATRRTRRSGSSRRSTASVFAWRCSGYRPGRVKHPISQGTPACDRRASEPVSPPRWWR